MLPNVQTLHTFSFYTSISYFNPNIQMGFDGFANELVLKLALNSSSMAENKTSPTKKPDHPLAPSLTLALSGDSCGGAGGGSSFSNASVKREREDAGDESEKVAANSSGEEDEDGSVNGRKKLRLTKAQSGLLEEAFKLHTTLNPQQKQELARDLKLRPRQVEVWFQNRRARTKLKQTEVDCEYLKKCCKRLTDENQKLRQEVRELKAQKVSQQPIYMQLPAAKLTAVCPSCEQIGDTNPASGNIPYTMAPKRQFLNPFSSSSAAC